MSHKMNPFDFVPFSKDKPVLKTIDDWFKIGNLQSGYIEIQIKAETPVHIVGCQDVIENGKKITKSYFIRRNNKAYIPSSSIRGILRAFVEASCNCWASQLTPYYLKDQGKRQVGFQVIDSREELKKKHDEEKIKDIENYALPEYFFMPSKLKEHEKNNLPIDLASFIFGFIPREGTEYKDVKAFKGIVSIEDAEIESGHLAFDEKFCFPDIAVDAFMGGGKPNISSWWYLSPKGIHLKRGQYGEMVEFVGSQYRGRKFYYHQNPGNCINWYQDSHNWPKDSKRPLYLVPMECLIPEQSTKTFRLYFEELPDSILQLLLFALQPGKRIRHKLGYGKPYGYGSIAINITKIKIRKSHVQSDGSLEYKDKISQIHTALWQKEKLDAIGFGKYLHWPSVESLLKILWYSPNSNLVFTYPVFNPGYEVTDKAILSLKNENLEEPFLLALNKLKGAEVCIKEDFFYAIKKLASSKPSKEGEKLIKRFTECVRGGFLPVVTLNNLRNVLSYEQNSELTTSKELEVNDSEAQQIARKLAEKNLRTALHFEVYKERAEGNNSIKKRKMNIAEISEGDQI